MHIRHLNCGILHAPPSPEAWCHCLLIEHDGRLMLIDTGIGLEDIAHPELRIGQDAIEAAGFQFHEQTTAIRQVEQLGYRAEDVTDIVLTHADPDHVGGLADFPNAAVHIAEEELVHMQTGHARYSLPQVAHGPKWVRYPASDQRWFGLEQRPLSLTRSGIEAALVPLFGHTLGHCGVAIRDGARWLLHVGDAYYLRVELSTDDHPVSRLSTLRADNDDARHASLAALRQLHTLHGDEIEMFGYHDFTEFAADVRVNA